MCLDFNLEIERKEMIFEWKTMNNDEKEEVFVNLEPDGVCVCVWKVRSSVCGSIDQRHGSSD